MKEEHQIILNLIQSYLENHPDQRFGQALFNLRINEFKDYRDPSKYNYAVRDIHGDADNDIILRIKSQLEWFELQRLVSETKSKISECQGMSINEKLNHLGFATLFEQVKKTNRNYAIYILEALNIDKESILKILDNK